MQLCLCIAVNKSFLARFRCVNVRSWRQLFKMKYYQFLVYKWKSCLCWHRKQWTESSSEIKKKNLEFIWSIQKKMVWKKSAAICLNENLKWTIFSVKFNCNTCSIGVNSIFHSSPLSARIYSHLDFSNHLSNASFCFCILKWMHEKWW